MKLSLHSKTMAAAISVLALGTVVVTGVQSPASAARLTAQSSDGSGYWLAGSDGGVFAFGTAHFYGSLAGKHLAAPISGIVPSADDHGYWLVGRDGAVYPFGDATARGSMAGKALAGPVVGIAATRPDSGGEGIPGPRGPAGHPGAPGNVGPVGPAGQPDYAYVYNETPETIAIEADIPFDSSGALVGFTHVPGTATITVNDAGTYRVNTVVSATAPNQVALFVNGVVVPGSVYGSGAGAQSSGQNIVDLAAGDQLTLRNHSSFFAFGLAPVTGGTQANVNASVLIQELAPAGP